MDQGSAAVWAAGFGVLGTLAGSLGGAYLQRKAALQQVREQAAAEARRQLRDERRTAFATVLDRLDAVGVTLNQIVEARAQPDWRDAEAGGELSARQREVWEPADAALRALRRAAWTLAVTGPDAMADLATEIHKASAARVLLALRSTDEWEAVRAELTAAGAQLDDLRSRFIQGAQAVLVSPES